ncbi:hypothetical protein BDN72DRAFT_866118 [Pluteus cervinus]|uniref:Uncharacterized protein n=1 Tax=Pluteus cervinus TaxID=181527 RepID=A0ACD2ZY13_9AGAR|nr:hypothetical protein BDN72DRAFT_866118 [Pluteus cervinus]
MLVPRRVVGACGGVGTLGVGGCWPVVRLPVAKRWAEGTGGRISARRGLWPVVCSRWLRGRRRGQEGGQGTGAGDVGDGGGSRARGTGDFRKRAEFEVHGNSVSRSPGLDPQPKIDGSGPEPGPSLTGPVLGQCSGIAPESDKVR